MYELYKRIRKSKEYPTGSKKIEEENPFLSGPCMLCIAAMDTQDKSVFGLSKEGMKMARLRVRGEANAKFDVREFPVSFLSMKLSKSEKNIDNNKEDQIVEFADKYFTPLVSIDGKKIDCETAIRNMRNVNIMSYCDGTITAQKIEEFIVDKMQKIGYSEEEISKIQSQMCMIPVATSKLTGIQKSTCISFMDINDVEVNDNITQDERKLVDNSEIKEGLIKYSKNESAYLIEGSGIHSLKEYQTNGRAMPVCLSSVVSKALQNSIKNAKAEEHFNPLSMEELISEVPQILEQAKHGKNLQELREEQDESIEYDGGKKLSDTEIELLEQLDESYDDIIKLNRELKSKKVALDYEKERASKIDEAVRENCSDITYLKILLHSGYQLGANSKMSEEQIVNSQSDREIIMQLLEKNDKTTINIKPKEIAEVSKAQGVTIEELQDSEKTFEQMNKDKETNIIGHIE